MNRKIKLFSGAFLALASLGLKGQTQSYTEIFNIGDETVLEINTSHADVEFDTWNKDQVEIVATVTLEGATEEEAKEFFGNEPFIIKGNSKAIVVSTKSSSSWFFRDGNSVFLDRDADFDFDFAPILENIEIPELPELPEWPEMPTAPMAPTVPPIPPTPAVPFDYEAYKKDGDTYLEKWSKKFAEQFDDEHAERFEAWGKKMEERAKDWEERNAKRIEERAERMEKRALEFEKRREVMEERREAMEKRREAAIAKREAARDRVRERRKIHISRNGNNSTFHFSSGDKNRKFKVKKSIKIRMPKSVKLKMNVRHGEVKLAAQTKNIKASLHYASLLASTVDGQATDILAAYTPIVVNRWNLGKLETHYGDKIQLKEVGQLELKAISSNITIERLTNKAKLNNKLGHLTINALGNKFTDLNVMLQHGEFHCQLPNDAVTLLVNDNRSDLEYPKNLNLIKTGNSYNSVHKGYWKRDGSNRKITVDAKYGEVVFSH